MQPGVLGLYNRTLVSVARQHQHVFNVVTVDSTASKSPIATGMALLREVLPRLETWADPTVTALPLSVVQSKFNGRASITAAACRRFLQEPRGLTHRKRSVLDASDSHVQLVACAAFRHEGQYVLIEREPRDPKAERFGARTLWHRCRIVKVPGTSLLDGAQRQMSERIRDDLHLSRLEKLSLLGAVWSDDDDQRKYLGILFMVEIGDADIAESLSRKSFRRGDRAPLLRTGLVDLDALFEQKDLDPWSQVAVSAFLKP